MQPRLIAVSGPLEGRTFPLGARTGRRASEEPYRLGRQPDNDLQIPSIEVSRHHCELVTEGEGRWRVRDLGSRHGVFVNGRPVRETQLAHSDQLTVGGTAFLFLLDEPTPAPTEDGQAADEGRSAGARPKARSTLLRNPTEALYLDAARVEAALPTGGRMARDLHSLLRASRALQGPRDLDQVSAGLADAVAGALPADGVGVALLEAGDGRPRLRARVPADLEVPIVDAMVEQVLGLAGPAGSEGSAGTGGPAGALIDRVDSDPALAGIPQIRGAGIRTLLAAPLLDEEGRPLGLVQAVHRSRVDVFDERHLDLLVALAGIGSLALRNALHLRWLRRENARLRHDRLAHDLVGESPAIRKILDLVARVAKVETTVLIRGESGTGKELVAQAIHRSSPRAEGPFLAINCATLSETLLESELFGHEKGAFTGAVARQVGKLEAAAGGTLFLDEVGEIPAGLQAKLLRVIQERRFERVGGHRPIEADVRVLAATHRDLEGMIREGSFREDLYYRLKVIALELPPLRERRDDIPLLAAHLAARHAERLGRRRVGVDPATRRCLMAYAWPGNVRELSNAIERALVLGDDDVIRPEDLPDEVAAAAIGELGGVGELGLEPAGSELLPGGFQASVTAFKRRLLLDAWERAGQDYSTAAELLGIHVNSLHRLVRNLGLKEQLGR